MNSLVRFGGARLAKRLSRSVPLIGGAIAIATIASTMRRKGAVQGIVDTGLNAVPFVGALKLGAEWWTGKDWFPDRPSGPRRPRV